MIFDSKENDRVWEGIAENKPLPVDLSSLTAAMDEYRTDLRHSKINVQSKLNNSFSLSPNTSVTVEFKFQNGTKKRRLWFKQLEVSSRGTLSFLFCINKDVTYSSGKPTGQIVKDICQIVSITPCDAPPIRDIGWRY